MRVGSLFSGIGGLDLGLERAGMEVVWQVEIDEYCRRVLAKHWPNVRRYEDIRNVNPSELSDVDLVCGGFPCQDISNAGKRAGIDGERSGLWREMFGVVCRVRPRFVLVENVAALLVRGLDSVLSDLASVRYDAEWSIVSACSMGAPHMRRRVFIVAYPDGLYGWQGLWNTNARQDRPLQAVSGFASARAGWQARLANPSELYRGADGLAFGLERNRGIGNSAVPQVAEWIGRRIMEANER